MSTMIVPILLLLGMTVSSHDPIAVAVESYQRIASYRVTLHSRHGGNEEIIRYFYKKPGFIRMEFVKPHKGALLVYDPTAKIVRLRPFGFTSLFVLALDPDNSLVKSAQGHRVDESDIGALLRRVQRLQEHGTTAVTGEETVGGRKAALVTVEGREGYSLQGIHRYLLWLDKTTHLPAKVAAYDDKGKLVEEVVMSDLEVNVVLEDGVFRL